MTMLEELARAMCVADEMNPDCLYEHHEWEDWPVDDRREHVDAFTGKPRVTLFHKAWRNRAKKLAPILPIITREIDRAKAEGWNAAVEKAAGIVSRGRCTNGSHRECEVVIQYGKAAAQVIQAWKDKHDDA